MSSLTWEYVLFVFIASCGVLQLVASHSKLEGLLFLRNSVLTHLLAIGAIVGSYLWFFGWGDRLHDRIMHTGLEGSQQVEFFLVGAGAALLFTLLVSSVTNRNDCVVSSDSEQQGLDLLRGCNFLQAIRRSSKKGNEDKE